MEHDSHRNGVGQESPISEHGNVRHGEDAADATSSSGGGAGGHKRSLSGSLLAKLPFLRTSHDAHETIREDSTPSNEPTGASANTTSSSLSPTSPTSTSLNHAALIAAQQKKTRRRKGSLRKAALLGRGAQRQSLELQLDVPRALASERAMNTSPTEQTPTPNNMHPDLDSEATPRASIDTERRLSVGILPFGRSNVYADDHLHHLHHHPANGNTNGSGAPPSTTSPTLTYTSTTDEDDMLSMPNHHNPALRTDLSLSSTSEPYYPNSSSAVESALRRRRSNKAPQSPLSLNTLSGLATSALPPAHDDDWDYTETEWWGWVILVMTWLVFVMGMGSCLGVWSWAWDVGQTPYAPPELEDDPTLPITGYYPALIILTAVMAWVWVVVAWVGMKYFRHAKISGD